MFHFCTYFDRNYLLRALTLYRSLTDLSLKFTFYFVCLDNESYQTIKKIGLANVVGIQLSEIEKYYPELLSVKPQRSLIEYYFTLTPFIPSYVLQKYPQTELITYLDADLYFYSHPQPIFDELGNNSLLMIAHRFPEHLKKLEIYGKYNVQFLTFRNDEIGRKCLSDYRKQCLDWCYDRLEDNKFADQKYLDDWPHQYPKVTNLKNNGAGLAPWNWMNYNIQIQNEPDDIRVDQDKLIFYHFHGLKLINNRLAHMGLFKFGTMKPPPMVINSFYKNYIRKLKLTEASYKEYLNSGSLYSDLRFNKRIIRYLINGLLTHDLLLVT